MSERPTVLNLFLPGIVAGMLLAAVVLAMGQALFPDAVELPLPYQTLLALLVAITAISIVGSVSLIPPSRGDDGKPRQRLPARDLKNKNRIRSGENHVL